MPVYGTTPWMAVTHRLPCWFRSPSESVSWAGMRGVVTLAIALALPEAMPGRDLILVAAFAVILVTVLGEGTTIGPLIRWVNPAHAADHGSHH